MPRSFEISRAHLDAFAEQQRRRFEDEMVVHLQETFPDESAKMGDKWLHDLTREGIKKAKQYDIVLEPDVVRYIELMVTMSPDFDESSKTPWAKGILTDPELTAAEKLDEVYEHVMFGGEEEEA